ncbi:peptidoglycan-binding protein [Streptomyces sp. NPDC020607]|uniref:peptidoglycan-binding protein n=1 Tax=Streptomyces sp. NPDC020607 TaxID=3365082 RepID=UPI0037B73F8A
MAGQGDEEAVAGDMGGDAGKSVDRARARSAAGAAAADFDPLRIRPYVSLPDPVGSPAESSGGGDRSGDRGAGAGADRPPVATSDVRHDTSDSADSADAEAGAAPYQGFAPPETPPEKRGLRKRPLVLLAGAGAGTVAALTAATVFAIGMLSAASDGPTRDRALPDDLASAHADPTKPAAPSANPPASSSRTPSAPPSALPSQSTSPPARSASPSPSSSSSEAPSTGRATESAGASASPPHRTADATLRQGDKGARVTELQGRLAQLYLYVGERDGSYSYEVAAAVRRYQWARGLRDDAQGEYGRETRRSLESETTEP